MKVSNNSVGRLFNILQQLQKNGSETDVFSLVLSKAFKITQDDHSQLLRLQIELLSLVKESKKEIEKLPEASQELHKRSLRKIEKAFNTNNIQSKWSNFNKYLDSTTMLGLEHTADTLSHLGGETIPENELEDLKRQVDELLELVIKTDMNLKLKRFLVEQLKKIQDGVLYYQINGSRGLKDALESIIGASFILKIENETENMPEGIKPKFSSIFSLLARLVALANDFKGLTGIDPLSLPSPLR